MLATDPSNHAITTSTTTSPPMKKEDLIASLHKIGRLYWYRPDTADCLVRVVKLSTCSHRHPPQRIEEADEERMGKSASMPALHYHSIKSMPASAGPSTIHFRDNGCPRGIFNGESCSKRKKVDTKDSESERTSGSRSPVHQSLSPPTASRQHLPQHLSKSRRESAPATTTSSCPHCPAQRNGKLYRLHKDFLIHQSSVLSSLLSSSTMAPTSTLSSNSNLPAIELPLPDPSVFSLFVEYFYMGDFSRLTSAMETGTVRWESVMLNARHLGLSEGLKTRLGGWWRLRQTRAGERQHRGSLPAKSLVAMVKGASGETERDANGLKGRMRAYTTGDRQDDPMALRMTPARAFAGLASPPRADTTTKRRSSPNYPCYTSSPDSQPSNPVPAHQLNTSPLPSIRAGSPLPSPRTLPHSLSHTEQHPYAHHTVFQPHRDGDKSPGEAHKPPSAVKQLLLGGKRRRALSSLAYYCSTGVPTTLTGGERGSVAGVVGGVKP